MNGTYSFVYSGPTGVGRWACSGSRTARWWASISAAFAIEGRPLRTPTGTIQLAIDQTVPPWRLSGERCVLSRHPLHQIILCQIAA